MSSAVLTILGMWAVTLAARYAGLSLGHLRLPPFWLAFLRYVPVSVFAALIVPGLLNTPDWPLRLLACTLAALLFWRTSLAWGIVGGFLCYLLLRRL